MFTVCEADNLKKAVIFCFHCYLYFAITILVLSLLSKYQFMFYMIILTFDRLIVVLRVKYSLKLLYFQEI